jgi:hypothetical protein
MMKGDKDLLGEQKLENFFGVLGEVRDLICKRYRNYYYYRGM